MWHLLVFRQCGIFQFRQCDISQCSDSVVSFSVQRVWYLLVFRQCVIFQYSDSGIFYLFFKFYLNINKLQHMIFLTKFTIQENIIYDTPWAPTPAGTTTTSMSLSLKQNDQKNHQKQKFHHIISEKKNMYQTNDTSQRGV